MNIIYSTDENYSEICLSSIRSLLENNQNVEELKIYIIDNMNNLLPLKTSVVLMSLL